MCNPCRHIDSDSGVFLTLPDILIIVSVTHTGLAQVVVKEIIYLVLLPDTGRMPQLVGTTAAWRKNVWILFLVVLVEFYCSTAASWCAVESSKEV